MNYGHLSSRKQTNAGYGLHCVERQDKSLPEQLVTEVKEHALPLWNNIPEVYRQGHCYSDFWQAYQVVIPEEQLTQVGKETGETAHVERWNNTLRQRLGRFVRKTLSFSKSILMHIACLDFFLHRSHLEMAISF